MTTDLRDLRTDIPFVADFPFVVVMADTDRYLARFANETDAIDWAEAHSGLVVDSTPALPPTAPGWYSSGRYPIDKPFADYQPYKLDELGDWRHYDANAGGMVKLAYSDVAAAMPLKPIGVLQ